MGCNVGSEVERGYTGEVPRGLDWNEWSRSWEVLKGEIVSTVCSAKNKSVCVRCCRVCRFWSCCVLVVVTAVSIPTFVIGENDILFGRKIWNLIALPRRKSCKYSMTQITQPSHGPQHGTWTWAWTWTWTLAWVISVQHLPVWYWYLGFYWFFSSGIGKWYAKVVCELLILAQGNRWNC